MGTLTYEASCLTEEESFNDSGNEHIIRKN
ncbi:hypothetical protein M2298_001766 [Brevibacillus sp. 1238]|nr:hypothetical protein [Brevibacillus sp. 1238]